MTICDIIIPVYNQPQLTRECVDSIIRTTHIPVNVVIVDNASDQPTKAVIKGFRSAGDVTISVIENKTNLGFPKAVNQGLKFSDSPYKLVLNSDTRFTDNCLKIMIDLAERSRDIGIVNPESNTFGFRPKNDETIEDVAKRILPLKDDLVEFSNCIGFAMLIKKELTDRTGYFDEGFGMAFFEDSDFSMRAKEAGYRCVKACGSYVFHHEHKSLDTVEWKENLFRKNRDIYQKRWGKPLRIFVAIGPALYERKDELKKVFEDAVALARKECYLHFNIASREPLSKSALFRQLGIPEITNIDVKCADLALFAVSSVYRILKKRKKRYNLVLAYDSKTAGFLGRMSFLFRCPVFLKSGSPAGIKNVTAINDLSKILGLKNIR